MVRGRRGLADKPFIYDYGFTVSMHSTLINRLAMNMIIIIIIIGARVSLLISCEFHVHVLSKLPRNTRI